MYFYLDNGKQCLDLTGNLIITHNRAIITTRVKSAGPRTVKHARYIEPRKLSFMGKVRATIMVVVYIWGKPESIEEAITGGKIQQ